MIGYLVTYRTEKYCQQKFFKDYHSFIYWFCIYMLHKKAHFHGDIVAITDPDEYEKMLKEFDR